MTLATATPDARERPPSTSPARPSVSSTSSCTTPTAAPSGPSSRRWAATTSRSASTADIDVTVHGNVGYYFAGMHQRGTATVHGSAGVGLAENIMSGVVHVTGRRLAGHRRDRPRRARRRRRQHGRPLRHLDEGRRHRRGRQHRPRLGVHGAGRPARRLRRRRRSPRRLDLRGAHLRARRGRLPRRRLRREGDAPRAPRRARRAARSEPAAPSGPRSSVATDRPATCTTSKSTTPARTEPPRTQPQGATMTHDLAALGLRESATFDRATISDIQRAAATGIYDIRGWGAKRALPHFDDLLFLGASMSRYPLEGYREKCAHRRHPRRPPRARADPPRHPGHDRRDELRRPLRQRQGGPRPRCDRGRHLHHHRRRRDDARGARAVEDPRLPVPARRATG